MKSNYIFIINGSGRSGKDSFCEYVLDWNRDFYGYNISSVDMVRQAAKVLGWNGEKDDQSRKFLSDLKDLSTEYNQGPLNYMLSCLSRFSTPYIGFFHIREPQEIQMFKDLLVQSPNTDTKTVLVKRGQNKWKNHADSNVENFDYDIVIRNDGSLYDLEVKARKIWTLF